MNEQDILNFGFELGQLRRITHQGWNLIAIENPETIAEHSLRAAQLAFILAKMENHPKPEEVVSIVVFHDIGECRIGDIHKVANRYLQTDEERAVKEQTQKLETIGEDIFHYWKQMEDAQTPAGIIAKDADRLEQALSAKEYLEKGYPYAQDWIDNISKAVKTESAKKLLVALLTSHSANWWQGLKKL